jgi:hypothetical protein
MRNCYECNLGCARDGGRRQTSGIYITNTFSQLCMDEEYMSDDGCIVACWQVPSEGFTSERYLQCACYLLPTRTNSGQTWTNAADPCRLRQTSAYNRPCDWCLFCIIPYAVIVRDMCAQIITADATEHGGTLCR